VHFGPIDRPRPGLYRGCAADRRDRPMLTPLKGPDARFELRVDAIPGAVTNAIMHIRLRFPRLARAA
jgi:hypothetical protein